MLTAYQFFKKHAGYSYDPRTETVEQGRQRCARALADAEARASERGYSFDWRLDDIDSSSFTDEKPSWALWQCAMFDESGECAAILGGIDFGRDGDPWGDTYRRVVHAELALEGVKEIA